MIRAVFFASLALPLAGCLTIPDGVFSCDAETPCPEGFACESDNRCYRADGDWTCRSGQLIRLAQLCDGVAQCADGSDEAKCTPRACPGGSPVLVTAQFCDGNEDCDEGEDEADCEQRPCLDGEGTMVPFAWLCDGDRDCPGFIDDPNRAVDEDQCVPCSDGSGVVHSFGVCDAWPDCADASDEQQCFYCDLANNEPYPRWVLCDGIENCEGGEDESFCDTSFVCAEPGLPDPFPAAWVCDGQNDCLAVGDLVGTDELESQCELEDPEERSYTPEEWPPVHECDGNEWPAWALCEGVTQCSDGSDELRENCPFLCLDGTRIPRSWVCDGTPDCPHGDDEEGGPRWDDPCID